MGCCAGCELGEFRDRVAREVEVFRVVLEADAGVAHSFGGGECRTRAGERIEDDSFAEGQGGAHDLTQERLGLEARMGCERTLRTPGGSGWNHVAKRLVLARTSEPPGLPLSEVVLDAAFNRLAKEKPRFPVRPRHHADLGKLRVGCLGSVTSPHGRGQADDLPAPFETGACQRPGDQKRQEGRGRDEDVRSGHEPRSQLSPPFEKKPLELRELFRRQGREPGKRGAPMAVKRRGYAPHSSAPLAKFFLLRGAVLVESVGRVCDHRVYGTRRLFVEPPERLRMKQGRATNLEGRAEGFFGWSR